MTRKLKQIMPAEGWYAKYSLVPEICEGSKACYNRLVAFGLYEEEEGFSHVEGMDTS